MLIHMFFPWARVVLTAALACCWVTGSLAQTASATSQNTTGVFGLREATAENVVLPESVPDPIELLNRVVWGFNKGLMTRVVRPTGRAYRAVGIKPVRTAIGNFGTNITYPGRLINNVLQGKLTGARDESYRFLCTNISGGDGFV